MLQFKATEHDYYCADHNYFNNDCFCEYDTWADFKEEWFEKGKWPHDDYNHVFRWDFNAHEDDYKKWQQSKELNQAFEFEELEMQIFVIQQRKGKFLPILIETIIPADLPEIEEFLKERWEYLKENWKEQDNA